MIVHVCGIPGSRKSSYCKWLEGQKEFLHLDFDELLRGLGTPHKLSLIALLQKNPDAFVSKFFTGRPRRLDRLGIPIVDASASPLASTKRIRDLVVRR
jgi:hypothetical protein